MLRLERRATPSSTMSVVSPVLAAARHAGDRIFAVQRAGQGSGGGVLSVLCQAAVDDLRHRRIAAQDDAAAALRTGSGAGLSRQCLEHRRRRAAHHGRDRRRRRRALVRRQRFQFCDAADAAGRRARRHGLGRHPGLPANPIQHQRNSCHADAGVHRPAGAVLAGARPVARSSGTKLPAIARFRRCRNDVGSDRRNARDLGHRLRRWGWR